MPSVYSFSRPSDCPSSTVMTPSLPTLSMTSAMTSPTSGIGRRDGGQVGDVGAGLERAGLLLELGHDGLDALLQAALDGHRVGARGHVLEAFGDDRLAQHDRGGGAVAGDVVGLGGDFLEQLGAHVLEGVVQLDLTGDRHAVVGDGGRTELLVEHHVAALGAEGHPDRVGQAIDAMLERPSRGLVEEELLCHWRESLLGTR